MVDGELLQCVDLALVQHVILQGRLGGGYDLFSTLGALLSKHGLEGGFDNVAFLKNPHNHSFWDHF